MTVGIITGTGTPSLPGLEEGGNEVVSTRWGDAELSRGRIGEREILHLSRHGEGHPRLSNHVTHRANIAALQEAGAEAVLAVTVCGAIDPSLELGSLVVFDDLHFPQNRLPDGSLCTFHLEAGDQARGHWISESPFSEALRSALLEGASASGEPARDGGCYGHVDGPRFNTRAEIRGLAAAGVTAVSQTAGPEAVLAGEAELPYALLGYLTDYANGANPENPTPVSELERLIGRSTGILGGALAAALERVPGETDPTGMVYRFEEAVRS